MRQRPLALFWGARVCATMSYQMLAVAIGWQVYDLTHSTLALGLVGLVQFLPVVLLSLVVGQVADRYDRRRVGRICQGVEGLAAAGLALGSATGWLEVPALYALVLVIGTARAFEQPTLQALLPQLVPPRALSRAVAGVASATQTAVIVGPALGGFLYVAGPAAVYGASGAGFSLASGLLGLIRLELPRPPRPPVTIAHVLAGIRYILDDPTLLGVISLDLFAVLLGGATALLPVYARDILDTGPWGLGLLRAAPALGALTSSMVLARFPLRRRVGRILFLAVGTFGVATILFAVSQALLLSLAALAVLGAADAISVVIRLSLVQLRTPDAMRGRVSTVNSLFIGTSNTLGEFESGLTATWFGTVPAVLIGGIGTLLVALIWVRAFPTLSRLDGL